MAVASEGRWKERITNGVAVSAKHPSVLVKPIAAGSKVVASHKAQSFEILRKHFSDAVAVDMVPIAHAANHCGDGFRKIDPAWPR